MSVEPVLFLPGRLCDGRLFAPQLSELEIFCPVKVVDLTGAESFEQMAQDVLAVAPPNFALAGLSLGGIVALEIIRQAPARVTRLALLDSNPGGNTLRNLEEFDFQTRQALAGPEDFLKLTTELFYPQMVHPQRLNDTALLEVMVAMALAVGPAAFVRQNKALQNRKDRWNDLARITCPTLVLSGREDLVCPLIIQNRLTRFIPGARQVIIEQCGHLSTLEQPRQVTAVLKEWLLAPATNTAEEKLNRVQR